MSQIQSDTDVPVLSVGRYRLLFHARQEIVLPQYAGSAWRGVFGHALKRVVCVTREPVCAQCLLYLGCPYSYIFETPPPINSDRMRRYNAAPHPFILSPLPGANRISPGSEFGIELIVLGRANDYLPYILYAFQSAGERGIGAGNGKFTLHAVEQDVLQGDAHWRRIWEPDSCLSPLPPVVCQTPECPASVSLEIQSPLRLKRDNDLVGPKEFEFHDLFRNLLRRIAMLMYFHNSTNLNVDFANLTALSRDVALVRKELRWWDWTRYSSRQRTTMQMGGVVGGLSLDGKEMRPFWPYLWLGQWTHAGKGAVMGLGKYRISADASLPNQTTAVC